MVYTPDAPKEGQHTLSQTHTHSLKHTHTLSYTHTSLSDPARSVSEVSPPLSPSLSLALSFYLSLSLSLYLSCSVCLACLKQHLSLSLSLSLSLALVLSFYLSLALSLYLSCSVSLALSLLICPACLKKSCTQQERERELLDRSREIERERESLSCVSQEASLSLSPVSVLWCVAVCCSVLQCVTDSVCLACLKKHLSLALLFLNGFSQ